MNAQLFYVDKEQLGEKDAMQLAMDACIDWQFPYRVNKNLVKYYPNTIRSLRNKHPYLVRQVGCDLINGRSKHFWIYILY